MNLLKSLFISSFIMLAMAIVGYAAWMLYRGEQVLAWTGVLLSVGPFVLLIGRFMVLQDLARTSTRLSLLNLLSAAGCGMAGWAWYGEGADRLAPLLAAVNWLGFLLYAYWYSSNGRQPSRKIRVGAPLPGFIVKGTGGATVTSAQLTDKPAILLFYRGNWCPLCMAQIKELVGRYQEIGALGVRLALISPQPHGHTVALARKFGVDFDFLTDEGNAAARALGIEHPQGLPMGMQMLGYDSETVLPTVIITDRNGKVVWTDETDNYRVRPEPDVYLDLLRRYQVLPVTQGSVP
jgi:peroxiredoxin